MSKKSLLSLIPKPILKKAINELENALEESNQEVTANNHQVANSNNEGEQISVVETRSVCAMSEVISWAQSNYPNEEGITLSIIKEKSDKKDYQHLIYLIWCRDNKPLLSDNYKSMAIYCNRLDDELYETFGNNDIITLE